MTKHMIRLTIGLLVLIGVTLTGFAQDDDDAPSGGLGAPDPNRPVGLTVNTEEAADGYILAALIQSKQTLLLAKDGRIVHRWDSDYYAGASAYLTASDSLVRTASLPDNNGFGFNGQWGFVNGRIEALTWDGEVDWSVDYLSDRFVGHHDIEVMPNGHLLLIAFERFSAEEAIAAGRKLNFAPDDFVV